MKELWAPLTKVNNNAKTRIRATIPSWFILFLKICLETNYTTWIVLFAICFCDNIHCNTFFEWLHTIRLKKNPDSPEKRVHNRRSQYWNKNYAISLSTLRPTFISTICHRNPLRRLCNNESSTHNNTYATHIWEYHGFQKWEKGWSRIL